MIGERIGDYEILAALKSGGMGDVLLARRRGPAGFEQVCAIKTVRAELSATPLARTMFLDEARLLARLTHPGIAQILDFGEVDGMAYMVMEYVPGMSFRGLVDKGAPPAVICQAMAQACRGLHAAHELRDLADGHLLGVVHRDVSPDNLMLGYDARVKVLDFGIALVRGRQAPVTELGTLKGKPPYMSPEQLKNLALDRRSDVFSVAVVLWELLTRQSLFRGESIYAVARAVEEQEIVAPSSLATGLPDGLDDVVLAGLSRDPEQRLATAAAMAEVLERVAARAGGVSLEAWAERALVDEREHHRRWLATTLAGGRGAPAMGRPSGVRTAIEASPAPATRVTVAVEGPPVARVEEEARPPARRGRWLALIGVVALAGGAAVGWRMLGGSGGAAREGAAVDASMEDAAMEDAVDAAMEDAAVDAAIADAAVDARVGGTRPPVDAPPMDAPRRAPVDAAPASAPPVDAALATGRLAVKAWSPAALVTVDGKDWGETPILARPIAVGAHEVVLRSPIDGAVVHRATVTVVEGKTTTVR